MKKDAEHMTRKEYKAKLTKLRNKIVVTFEGTQDRKAVAPALMGQTYKVGEAKSGLTPSQVAYRHNVARRICGLPKGVGFAKQWRDGTGEWAKSVQRELMPAILAMLLQELPKKRVHPTPEVSKAA